MQHILFVCSRNRLRSPTAEAVFAAHPGIAVASAGLANDAEERLTSELVAWADIIFMMEQAHARKLRTAFRKHLNHQRVICLGIPDDYAYMDPALLRRLEAVVPPHLGTVGA